MTFEAGSIAVHSADGHAQEPDDLFTRELPERFKVSANRRIPFESNGRHFSHTYIGMKSGEPAQYFLTAERMLDADGEPVDADVQKRIRALDADGVGIEVLHPGPFQIYWTPDCELAMAHARVYNDYVADTYLPIDRFIPVAAVPLVDVDASLAEIERVAALGYKGFCLPIFLSPFYHSEIYEPIWAAARDTGMVVTFHAAFGYDEWGYGMIRQIGSLPDPSRSGPEVTSERCYSGATYGHPAQRLIATLVGAGICERYPEVMFVSAENNANWLAGLMGAMDKAYTLGAGQADKALVGMWDDRFDAEHQPMMTNLFSDNDSWPYPLRPSEYIRRQIRCTFMDDPVAVACREITGVETLLWSSDYPHPEGTFPHSGSVVEHLFQGVSDEDRLAITGGNLSSLYKVELPSPA
jgi:predicted TIM-barrel fold metal-dependent hydrolase